MTKRAVLTKIDDEKYIELQKRRNEYGFKSTYEFLDAIVGMALLQMSRIEYRRYHPNEPVVYDEIDEMFSELENWEAPRYGERTKRGHKAWDYFGEQESSIPLQMTFNFGDDEEDGQGC